MNKYIIGLNVRGKTGREYGLPIEVQADDRFEAEVKARAMADADGFEVINVDYRDIIEEANVGIEY